jgi:hypothetical protein
MKLTGFTEALISNPAQESAARCMDYRRLTGPIFLLLDSSATP